MSTRPAALSQHQVNEAIALCDRMQATIAKLAADFEEMKRASDEFLAKHGASFNSEQR